MAESQSISERQKSDCDSCRDMLSDLPLSIIHIILSCLPIEEAVRTSILSRQWRYTWTSLPKLEFISKAEENKDEKTASEERLKKFISYALSVHKGSLHKFRLDGELEEPFPHMDEWLILLSTKDIRELWLTTPIRSFLLRVHSSIYSCNKLTSLHLFWCDVGPPPSTFKGFSFLKNLDLHTVQISNATIESLLSNSPLLESLQLLQVTKDEKDSMIRVNAPNLKYLKLVGSWTEMSMNAPLLAKVRVMLVPWNAIALQRGSFGIYTNFLGGCTNLEELGGFCRFTKAMGISMESCNPNLVVFDRLRSIVLEDVDFQDAKQQNVLARLLAGAPNLQYLKIFARNSLETRDEHFKGFGFESNFRMEKLRVVRMGEVSGLLPEIKLIEFLLERSPSLEEMSIWHIRRLGAEEIKDLTDKILGCAPASQTANIEVSSG